MRLRFVVFAALLLAGVQLAIACTGDDPDLATPASTPDGSSQPQADSTPPVLQCEAGSTQCGASCIDLTTDPLHCGKCSRDCGGGNGSCVESQCVAQTLANNYPFAHGVAVDETHVYFTVAKYAALPGEVVLSPVVSIPKTGGVPVTLSNEFTPVMITAYGSDIYWTNWGDSTVRSTGKTGGTVRTVLDAGFGSGPFEIRATDAGLFWAEVQTSRVAWLEWDAGSARSLAILPPTSSATSVSVDDTSAYFTVQAGPTSVRRADRDGGTVDGGFELVGSLQRPWGLAIDDAYVYFTEMNAGTLKRIPKAGGGANILASNLDAPRSVVVDGSFAYVAEFSLSGHIYRVTIDGPDAGALTTMASSQGLPIGLTQDRDFLYWANNGDGRIMKVRK